MERQSAWSAALGEQLPVLSNQIISKASPGWENAKYVIHREISSGSFGTTYVCRRQPDDLLCTAKILTRADDTTHNVLIMTEILCMRRLDHFGCVRLLDAFCDAKHGDCVLILELMDAQDLWYQMQAKKRCHERFSTYSIQNTFVQLLLGLHHMHSGNMLHRDMTPSNCLATVSGLVKIGDFGLSRAYDTLAEAVGSTMCGTADYLSPERWLRRPYGAAADVWSLGVVMYELIELRNPFRSPQHHPDIVEAITTQDMAPFSRDVDDHLHDLCCLLKRMLCKEPSQRPSTTQMLQDPHVKLLVSRFYAWACKSSDILPDIREKICRDITAVVPDVVAGATLDVIVEETAAASAATSSPLVFPISGDVVLWQNDGLKKHRLELTLVNAVFVNEENVESERVVWTEGSCCASLVKDNAFVIVADDRQLLVGTSAQDASRWVAAICMILNVARTGRT